MEVHKIDDLSQAHPVDEVPHGPGENQAVAGHRPGFHRRQTPPQIATTASTREVVMMKNIQVNSRDRLEKTEGRAPVEDQHQVEKALDDRDLGPDRQGLRPPAIW
jgi:hypothetical protein